MVLSHPKNQHEAQVIADTIAVTAAQAALYGYDPCIVATQMIAETAAELQDCQKHGADILIQLRLGTWGYPAQAQARAGPRPHLPTLPAGQ